ncbi:Clavaminate synthase-like protein, partial [Saccharata proteae CBS 121410]
ASLYLAQCSITDLPVELQRDLPMPAMLEDVDIYQSSVWVGVAPTNTPLHRDPHPNLFVQMAGQKRVRLFEPDVGLSMFQRVRALVGNTFGMDGRIRGEEMMVGEEKEELEKVVWGAWEDSTPGQEVLLPEGSGLIIPQGWWHSVKGVEGGKVNASVNWWFR